MKLEMKGIKKSFGANDVLQGIDFCFPAEKSAHF